MVASSSASEIASCETCDIVRNRCNGGAWEPIRSAEDFSWFNPERLLLVRKDDSSMGARGYSTRRCEKGVCVADWWIAALCGRGVSCFDFGNSGNRVWFGCQKVECWSFYVYSWITMFDWKVGVTSFLLSVIGCLGQNVTSTLWLATSTKRFHFRSFPVAAAISTARRNIYNHQIG